MSQVNKPAVPRASGGPAAPQTPGRRPLIQVDPGGRSGETPDLLDRLRREAKSGLPGLAVSAGLHAVLLAVMLLIFVEPLPRDVLLDVTLEWGLPQPETGEAARSETPDEEPFLKPISIVTTNTAPQENAPPAPPTEPRSAPAERGEERPGVVKPVPVERLLDGRSEERRAPLLQEAGGTEATERAIADGLRWLRRIQQPGGNWQLHQGYPDAGYTHLKTDTGATALALLALIGHGNTHQGGEHHESVRKGLEWLLAVQKPDGDFHDHDDLGRQTAYYAHSQATIAVCELYALTRDERLREPAERAVRFLIESQQPVNGGWKYQPQNDRTVADLSVTGWALMALHMARVAGIEVPEEAFQLASRFLDSVQEEDGAQYRYEPTPDKPVTEAMTAEGLLCRQFLGWPKDEPAMRSGVEYLLRPQHDPEWKAGRRNVYAWYYTGHVLHNLGGEDWAEWYARVQQQIVENQVTRGTLRGSWSPNNPSGADAEHSVFGGRLYVTALSLLILEMPYRHLPVYAE